MKRQHVLKLLITAPGKDVKLALGSGCSPSVVIIPKNTTGEVHVTRLTSKQIAVLKTAAQSGCRVSVELPFGQSYS